VLSSRDAYERQAALARDQLGADDFAAAWAAGRDAPLGVILAEALAGAGEHVSDRT
jgi:hypothetical protein